VQIKRLAWLKYLNLLKLLPRNFKELLNFE
jgi:hypothetical protein